MKQIIAKPKEETYIPGIDKIFADAEGLFSLKTYGAKGKFRLKVISQKDLGPYRQYHQLGEGFAFCIFQIKGKSELFQNSSTEFESLDAAILAGVKLFEAYGEE